MVSAWKPILYRLLGHHRRVHGRVGIEALDRDWTYRRSTPDGVTRLVRLVAGRGAIPAPANRVLIPIGQRSRWIVYFVYLPDGRLTAAHRFTLDRLRTMGAGVAVICASRSPALVPDELRSCVDALYWKDLGGFDFSAYALALHDLATYSPGSDVMVLNDSMFGPFVSPDEIWGAMHWDLTGFTASAEIENHIQSYAFLLRDWTPEKIGRLHDIFPRDKASESYRDTVYGRESRFAAKASRFMSVGALWYADGRRAGDATVYAALPLLDIGFPFLKRSTLLRNAHLYEPGEVLERLRDLHHPVVDLIPVGLPVAIEPNSTRRRKDHGKERA